MSQSIEVVVTGIGVVSPIGIGKESFWAALCAGQSGIGKIKSFDPEGLPVAIAAEIDDFDPRPFVAKRKNLKVMCRDAQLGVAASSLACEDANLAIGDVDPERFGVVLGADRICSTMEESEQGYRACMVDGRFDYHRWATEGMAGIFPLNLLKVLPNMLASHISITHDARGPNNTIHHAEVSGLAAVGEAAAVIRRGAADAMLAGGASSQMAPLDCVRRCVMGILSRQQVDPAAAVRPFDADRDGQVWGEGAAIFVLENRRHAEARGADILAHLLSYATTFEPHSHTGVPQGIGLRRAMRLALDRAGIGGRQLGHVNAHGLSTVQDDQIEARALLDVVPSVPVTAPKSFFGNLGAAGGAMEMAASVLALDAAVVPATLNYQRPDPSCPLQVIRDEPMHSMPMPALLVNRTWNGQAAAAVVAGPG